MSGYTDEEKERFKKEWEVERLRLEIEHKKKMKLKRFKPKKVKRKRGLKKGEWKGAVSGKNSELQNILKGGKINGT